MTESLQDPQYKAEQVKFTLSQTATDSYNCDSFKEANAIMAELVRDTLGDEAADSLGLSDAVQKEKLKAVFHDAALKVVNGFRDSFDEKGDYLSEKEPDFRAACDQEGPIAKQALGRGLEVVGMGKIQPEHIKNILNNVSVEDALKLTIKTIKSKGLLDDEQCRQIEREILDLCKDTERARDVFSRAVPADDYYYGRIYRKEKLNDESVLKFNNGESHNDDDLRIIDLSLRLANATWLAAQRHCAKKDGKMDRIDPNKRGGVFNTPDHRHVQQFKGAIASGLSHSEAVMRVVFELCKDSWMLED